MANGLTDTFLSISEGFMATGVASEATDEAIQANIVAAQYSGFTFPTGEGPDA